MVWFIFAIIFAICAVILFRVAKGYAKQAEADTGRRGYNEVNPANAAKGSRAVAFVLCGLALLFFLLSVTVKVGTKEVGVVTTFGKPVGTLDNGLHLKAPWQSVTELDEAIQTDTDTVSVRMANQYRATIDTTIRWRLVEDEADDLYRDYRTFDNIRDSLVTKQLINTMNEVFASYDPLKHLSTNPTPGQVEDSGLLGDQVKDELQKTIGDQIEVLSVFTPRPDYDEATESKISQYQQAIANTRIAAQEKQTAAQNAKANKILSSSVSHDPNVLVSKCFDALTNMVKEGQKVPAGFTCWPGGGTGVVIPSGK